jgi:hypothetical protein
MASGFWSATPPQSLCQNGRRAEITGHALSQTVFSLLGSRQRDRRGMSINDAGLSRLKHGGPFARENRKQAGRPKERASSGTPSGYGLEGLASRPDKVGRGYGAGGLRETNRSNREAPNDELER